MLVGIMESIPFNKKDTLAQKICRTFPDAAINSPNVVIVGAQNVGKTKLILSLVSHHLIDKDFFTDAIEAKILKLFFTGSEMATRRPTTVNFSSDTDSDSCVIRLEMGNKHAEFSDDGDNEALDNLLNQIEAQSKENSENAYGEEVVLSICAPTLPNINFTDLPG